jgi:signal transduction histidine kinase
MKAITPRLTLGLLLLAALAILAGGLMLAKHTEKVRMVRDRSAVKQFAAELQRELRRLEAAHERHLLELAKTVNEYDALRAREVCETISGVVELSVLQRSPESEGKYLRVGAGRSGSYPEPTFQKTMQGRATFAVLDPAALYDRPGESSGWFEEPAKPLFFWFQRTASAMVLLTVEPREVRKDISSWIEEWVRGHVAGLRHAGGVAELMMPDGQGVALGEDDVDRTEPPHWLQSVSTRYGTWVISAWDPYGLKVNYHTPTVIVSAVLAVLVALLGFFVFQQQRRALRLAAQRVSFVNRVSHELRTPLTNMLLNLDIVADAMPEAEGNTAPRLQLVREEAARLSRLIENVLTFSRHENGRLRMRAIQCRPRMVVDGITEQFESSFARRGIQVQRRHEGDDLSCWMDADALAQITANLLSNVEKYAPQAQARVITRQDEKGFTLTVEDEGPGIPVGDAERIFEPFIRLDDSVSEGASGAGLGLAIAKDLAQRMGGTLRLLKAAKGAAFEFCMEVVQEWGESSTMRQTKNVPS